MDIAKARIFAVVFFLFAVAEIARAQDTIQFAIAGDAGLTGPDIEELKDSILINGFREVILPGDNLYAGRYDWTWDGWKRVGLSFPVVAIGNHNGGYGKEMSYFSMPGEYYSKVIKGARFIVLNSDNEKTATEQCSWLENELEAAEDRLIFLVYHHPSYDLAAGHSWRSKESFQKCIRPILSAYKAKISAVLLGHDHISTLVDFGGVPAIVAGSGREVDKSKSVSYKEGGVQIQTAYLAPREKHWVSLTYREGDQKASIAFHRVQDQAIVCRARVQAELIELDQSCRR